MDRDVHRIFRGMCGVLLIALVLPGGRGTAVAEDEPRRILVSNPYEEVDWNAVGRHKAALHVHTLQSDGRYRLETVVRAYNRAGFDILAITDHDHHAPNIHADKVEDEPATPYPDPEPIDFPTNTTWPWPRYGAPTPGDLGMVGIEGSELSTRHHMNSYFNGYGIAEETIPEDEQIKAVHVRNGLLILNHPGLHYEWKERRQPTIRWGDPAKVLGWYAERFRRHPDNTLIGLEVSNNPVRWEDYDAALWDQLLARFMPHRPVWGFSTDDMHSLHRDEHNVREAHTIFLLDELSRDAVRRAMGNGRFYFQKSTRRIDLRDRPADRRPFPAIEGVEVDRYAGTITVHAFRCDRIEWISKPDSLEPFEPGERPDRQPWPKGRVVETGPTLDYRRTPGMGSYVRIKLIRSEEGEKFRTYTNPFGFAVR